MFSVEGAHVSGSREVFKNLTWAPMRVTRLGPWVLFGLLVSY